MAGHSHEQSVKIANKTILVLAAITIFEVVFALVGKGHIGSMHFPNWLMASVMIILSIVKAYLIVSEFMHMKHEHRGLAYTTLLPLALLIWAVCAFLMEGSYWQKSRDSVKMESGSDISKSDTHTKHVKDIKHTSGH